MTIDESSEFHLVNHNSRDTISKTIKPLTPMMVQSIYMPING